MIGVLALQGAFESHQQRLTELGALSRQVRTPRDLAGVDTLVFVHPTWWGGPPAILLDWVGRYHAWNRGG